MPRKTIFFGNGLSMAVDRRHYQLSNAIDHVWYQEELLSDDERQFILQCLPSANDRPPEGEHELDILHLAVTACGFLDRLSGDNVEWLSQQGRQFPRTIERFVHKTATYLHNHDAELPPEFIEPFCEFLRETKSHVATLNYDKLLYNALIENDLFDGFRYLVDGMWDRGFHPNNLERKYGNNFGYYLHLHGSPLFYGKGVPRKMPRDQLDLHGDCTGEHIVLTHVRHKPSVIAASKVLSAYWEYLDVALSESEEIIVFGYGGMDSHLNRQLKTASSKTNLKIVEWSGSSDEEYGEGEQQRRKYWKRKIGQDFELVQMDNILSFHDW
ncbi:SIR2 family protein [Onishia taeanensis]